MQIFDSSHALSATLNELRNKGKAIGFIPTMGALHNGHISLVKNAQKENDVVVISIFVNPTQFNNSSDLVNYPRIPDKDIAMLKAAGGDILFMPTEIEMYPEGATSALNQLQLDSLGEVMEAKHRPGHFDGVVTVVRKLFMIVGECKAYFGQKDFQQLAVVRKLVNDEKISVEIISCAIVRELDGLAMSSRNMRLSSEQRQAATVLYQALSEVKRQWETTAVDELKKRVVEIVAKEELVQLEYFEIVDRTSLLPVKDKNNAVACIAAHLGEIRLIDNVVLD